jgi:hypothetical protein
VTGLGEFSPIGWLFTLGSFLKMTEVAQNNGLHYVPVMYLLWQKMGWATFWATCSQTRLVTLTGPPRVKFVP